MYQINHEGMKFAKLLIIYLSTLSLIQAQSFTSIDSLLKTYQNVPGCAVGVFQGDKILYQKTVGFSNLDYDVPVNEHTVFEIGSLSKQFTAACILLLEAQGKLSLEDPVEKYIPEVPVFYQNPVQIQHLLHHTSGLRDYLLLLMLSGDTFNKAFDESDGLKILERQKQLNFSPGSQFEYSNSGYLALAIIIRRVSGLSIGEFARQHIFEPLQMQETCILEDANKVIRNRAIGYMNSPEGYRREHYYDFALGGDGQIYTSIHDLFRWHLNFRKNMIGLEDFQSRMSTRGVLNNSDTIDYACGLVHEQYHGRHLLQHSGAWGGSRAFLLRVPEDDLSIVLLSNNASVDPSLPYRIADLFFPEIPLMENSAAMEEQDQNQLPTIPPEILAAFEGSYQMQVGVAVEIYLKEDTLWVRQSWDNRDYPIVPVGINRFQARDLAELSFEFTEFENGKPQKVVSAFRGDEIQFTRPGAEAPNMGDLTPYTGIYLSEELNCRYSIWSEGQHFFVSVKKNPPVKLHLSDPDQFSGYGLQLRFQRQDGRVYGFLLDAGTVKNIKFLKE